MLVFLETPENLDTLRSCCNYPKNFNGVVEDYTVTHPKDADRMANSVDPDQTAPPV